MLQTKEEQNLLSPFISPSFLLHDAEDDLHIALAKQFHETYFTFMKKLARLTYEPKVSKADKNELTVLFNKILYLRTLIEKAEETED